MSIMQKIFGQVQPAPVQPAQPAQPVPTNNLQQAGPTPTVAPEGTTPEPLAKYEKLWEPSPAPVAEAGTPITAQAIMGALPFEGKLPISINKEFKVSQGIKKPSLSRLQYAKHLF